MKLSLLAFAPAPLILCLLPSASQAAPLSSPSPVGIVGGSPVGVCGWPTTVSTDGSCTGTLIHPQAISTAQHCGMPNQVVFTDQLGGPSQTRAATQCVGTGSQDSQICLLDEPVLDLPVTPILFGCEVEKYMQVGQPVVIAGFGQTSYGMGGGTKLWANQTISAVEPGRVIIGEGGDGTSPCPGDSGGPVFLQVDDGTWRVFGTVLGGTTGTPCNSAADFNRPDAVVASFEAQTGVDITPCFDGATGTWEATESCGGFLAGDHTGSGSWPDWCAGTPAGGYSAQCGDPFASDPTTGTGGGSTSGGGSGGTDTQTTSDAGDGSSTDGGSGSSSTESGGGDTDTETDGAGTADGGGSGCGCTSHPVGPLWAVFTPVLVALRRRRDR